MIHAKFLVLRATRVHPKAELYFEYGPITLYGNAFQRSSSILLKSLFLSLSKFRCESIT
jgi:hypothetical protein